MSADDLARNLNSSYEGDHWGSDAIPEEDLPYRGKMLGGASAPICAGFGPNPIRYLYNEPATRILVAFEFILAVLAVGAFAAAYAIRTYVEVWWSGFVALPFLILSGLFVLIGLIVLALLVVGYKKKADYFKNSFLTPGVLVSEDPLVVVVLAPLCNGSGSEYHGLQRLSLNRLPYHEHRVGTRVPMVSAFYRGEDLDRWLAFSTEPIAWGTGKRANMDECFHRLGTADFDRLEACIRKGLVPKDDDELILLDGHDRKLQSLSVKEEQAKHKNPSDDAS